MRLTQHVEFALRRAYGIVRRNLDDARRDLNLAEERLREDRERVARHEAEETELREALEGHARAEAEASAVEAAEARLRDPETRLHPGLTVPAGPPLGSLPQEAELPPHPADTRRARESWEH